jgi:hypothetical protein
MSDPEHHSETSRFKTRVGTVIAALIGLLAAVVSLFLFVFDLLVTPEMGELIVSFVVCGMGLTTGFIMLRRLFPRREPETLFAGSCGVIVPDAPPPQIPAQRVECPPESISTPRPVHRYPEIAPVMKSHGSESIATHKTHDGAGFAAVVTVVGVTVILVGRLAFAWQFLALALFAGGSMALGQYWARSGRQGLSAFTYTAPVAGGLIFAASLVGVGFVMSRFALLRVFLGLSVGFGGALALVLAWIRRKQSSSNLFVSLL